MSVNYALLQKTSTILLALAAAACRRDSATGPASSDEGAIRIEAVSPVQVEGIVDKTVNVVPTVIVRNAKGAAVRGIEIIFNPLHEPGLVGGGSVTDRIAKTDSRGIATPGNWILGTTSGSQGLEARILDDHYWSDESLRVVTFYAEAKAAAPAVLSKQLFFGDTVGLPGDELSPPTVVVTDKFGNDVSGVPITFSVTAGGGSLRKTQAVTTRFGGASPGGWTLGAVPGPNAVAATAPGLSAVTFNSRALDAGVVTWYDIVPQSVRLIVSGSLALCEDGTFELVTVENSDAFPGEWLERQIGKYTLSGTAIELRYLSGVIEQGTVVNGVVTFVHKKDNWVNYPLENWTFVIRKRS